MRECLIPPLKDRHKQDLNMYEGASGLVVFESLTRTMGTEVAQEKNLFDGLQHAEMVCKSVICQKALMTGISKM